MWRNISLYAIPLGIALVAACGGSSNSSDDGGGGGSGSSSGGGSGDAGVICGMKMCALSEVCCFASTQPSGVVAGACATSTLTCSSKSSCGSGQSCCFTYSGDSGTDFKTGCQDSCDSASYQLCVTSADCDTGGLCLPGRYSGYCSYFDGGGFAFPDGGFTFGDGGFRPRRDASASDASRPEDDGSASDDDGSAVDATAE